MPLDSTNWTTTDTRTRREIFWASSPHDRLRMLAEDLRGDMANWNWNFAQIVDNCGTAGCALGLAKVRYGMGGPLSRNGFCALAGDIASGVFGLDSDEIEDTFFSWLPYGVWEPRYVTPAMVADRIDEYLAGQRAA